MTEVKFRAELTLIQKHDKSKREMSRRSRANTPVPQLTATQDDDMHVPGQFKVDKFKREEKATLNNL